MYERKTPEKELGQFFRQNQYGFIFRDLKFAKKKLRRKELSQKSL